MSPFLSGDRKAMARGFLPRRAQMTIPRVRNWMSKDSQRTSLERRLCKTRPSRSVERKEKCASYKPDYDEPVIEFILDSSHSTRLEPQRDCNAGDCEADGACSDDVGGHVVRDVQFLLLDFGGRRHGSHIVSLRTFDCSSLCRGRILLL